ncbi:hypothetical protein SAMN05444858_108163 [Micromonospora avicenniae]|uniref:Uncharacterized protein n=1 Tax=Micromonospora avicenniae TaxID=1198245 RepID=A0A1N6ZYJ5_9ACTN|nr:hypothetical protein SAMN05444858_108163 [Micromonospora avicenniae]
MTGPHEGLLGVRSGLLRRAQPPQPSCGARRDHAQKQPHPGGDGWREFVDEFVGYVEHGLSPVS